MTQLFAILLLLQTLPNPTHIANATPCATHVQPPRNPAPMHPDCNLADLFPPGFSQAWIADSLCDRHFRLHQRKVFFPNRNIEQRIKLEGATERCILAFFGKPYKVIEEKDGRGTRGFIYLMNIDSVDKSGAFDQGTFLRIYIRGGVVVKYSICIT